jgi:hypothetical protein
VALPPEKPVMRPGLLDGLMTMRVPGKGR